MRALRSFTVRARLPQALAPLQDLALNLRWSWDDRTRDLFRWVDPQVWETSFHDPVGLLGLVGGQRLESLAADPTFMSFLTEIHDDLQRSLAARRWFQQRRNTPLRGVAYFSPEFGLAEAIPQYSGGLGVLAGDHLKAASSLGVPLTGIGLLYHYGYFRQHLNADGWQEEHYPPLDPHQMALRLNERPTPEGGVEPVTIEVSLADRNLTAQIWVAQVGRVKLHMLDADVDTNDEELRSVTDRLYGGGSEHRLRQEILLGIGGVRALEALGIPTQVFHTNEGHAGFLGLERIRRLITDEKLSWREAIEAVRSGTLFTTHTPVPAGIDRFPRDLMEKYFRSWAEECGVSIDTLMRLGHFADEGPDAPFNMAVMGLHLAGMSNGVAKLHGKTSREMFAALWPAVPTEEVPIGSVTNGVHGGTWVSSGMSDLLSKYVSPAWEEATPEEWARILDAREDEVWRVREEGKEQLVTFVRDRIRAAELARGVSETDTSWTEEILDPRFLIVGFSRRFASYKRATLLLSQPERLKELLLDETRPLQLLFAGKAHPADDLGKAMIAKLAQFSEDPEVRHRIAFIENYDISVARMLYQGSDVWLNTPRRPMEASGTSGEKAALNGALNCSILDGWWDEMFDGNNGWAIASAEAEPDLDLRDHVEANSLFEILERQILPLYYDRRPGERFPRQWVQRIQHSLGSLGSPVSASRMVRDYVTGYYEPIAGRTDALDAGEHKRAKELAAWKERVSSAWPSIKIVEIGGDTDQGLIDLGGTRTVGAEVALGSLTTADVTVELLHGQVGMNDELADFSVVTMLPSGPIAASGAGGAAGAQASLNTFHFEGSFECGRAGRHGYTVRVVPAHADLATWAELGLVTWA
jgi:glycogen phosphorylase